MITFIIRRLIQGVIVLVVASALIYFLLTLIPGGPLTGMRVPGSKISQGDLWRLGYLMGLNDLKGHPYPWYERYARWLFDPSKPGIDISLGPVEIKGGGILTGNWGQSITFAKGRPVMELIGQRLPFTLILMTCALLISLGIAMPIGIISLLRPVPPSVLVRLDADHPLRRAVPTLAYRRTLVIVATLFTPLTGV